MRNIILTIFIFNVFHLFPEAKENITGCYETISESDYSVRLIIKNQNPMQCSIIHSYYDFKGPNKKRIGGQDTYQTECSFKNNELIVTYKRNIEQIKDIVIYSEKLSYASIGEPNRYAPGFNIIKGRSYLRESLLNEDFWKIDCSSPNMMPPEN